MHLIKGKVIAPLAGSALLHAFLVFMPDLGKRDKDPTSSTPSQIAVTLAPQTVKEKGPDEPPSPSPVHSDDEGIPLTQRSPDIPPLPQKYEGIGLLPIPAPTYYVASQLTKRPQPAAAINLDPPNIHGVIATGKMVILLWINEHGTVDEVELEQSDLPTQFGEAALAAMRDARFVPGELHGIKVRSKLKIEVTYDDGREIPGKNRGG
jgi:TonB family protein